MKSVRMPGLLLLALSISQIVKAQTADEVVNKYISSMGGKEKLVSLKTVRMQGTRNVLGKNVALTITKKHLIGMRADIFVMGTENYQIITPTKGIVFMPIEGMTKVKAMTEDQVESAQPKLDIQGVLVDYKLKGIAIELKGKDSADGQECYHLRLAFKNRMISNYYISVANYRIIEIRNKVESTRYWTDSSIIFGNYKQNSDGYWFPYAMTNKEIQTNFFYIKTNIPIDESIFQK